MMLRFSSPSPPLTPPSPPVSLPVCLLSPPGCTRITSNSTSLNPTSFSFPPPPPISLSPFLWNLPHSPSSSAKNLGVTLDPCLSYSQHISTLARTCRFFLSNIRRIRPFLTSYATQLLVQALVLSRLDYCNSLLAGLPASVTRPLQLIPELCCSPGVLSASLLPRNSTGSRSPFASSSRLVLAYRCLDQTASSYLQTLISPYTPT
ncbi:UNVERIFIED_CONTAM: hypothetical protein FKN15_044494 [Acipenser sinensis]